jgi:hypothetical protein
VKVDSAAVLAAQLNTAFAGRQPAPLLINFVSGGRQEGHTLLAYNYQSPDPTTGEGIAVDVVDPNVPWHEGESPNDYQALQVHVKANGSWTFSASTKVGDDFGDPVGGASGSLEVVTHPRAPGGLSLNGVFLAGNPAPIGLAPPLGGSVTAIGYSATVAHGIPSTVTTEPLSDDGEDNRLVVPAGHPKLTVTFTAPLGANEPMRITGAVTVPVATKGMSISSTSIVGGIQRSATVTFTGKVRKPTLAISHTGQVTLTTSGGNGNAAIALATYNAGGEQAHARPERLTLHGRTRLHRHTPKIKRRKHRRSKRKPRRKR